eukprot:CAMPEP_0183737548 /NCGR_PEP_ID=MMETSP0737-20130205/52321_1 /TAXON_ID=385413 /ORGANISM="Thalassiosira miniscula, Strain CCMP1093" /LENGTH=112 /DNA_ID=CAMNT_0025971851 /DNA_START=81 /DNA_END=415 /DNA_ORIENTATION=+
MAEDGGPPITADGTCPHHPVIQLRRKQRRTGEWKVILNNCPLCASGLPAQGGGSGSGIGNGAAAPAPTASSAATASLSPGQDEDERSVRSSISYNYNPRRNNNNGSFTNGGG